MPLENITRNEGPDAELAAFSAACQAFWPNVTKIVLHRMKPRQPLEIRAGTVVHMTGRDEKPIDDSKGIIEGFAAAAKADAERNGPSDYRIAVWGHRTMPTKARKVVAPVEELHSVRFRLGEGPDEESKGDASLIREAAQLIKANASATHDLTLGVNNISTGYEKLIGLQAGMLTASADRDRAHTEASVATAGIQLEIKKLEFNFEVQKETWRREDQQHRIDAENELRSEQARQAYHLGMMREGKELASMFMSMWQISRGITPPQPPPPPGVDPSDGTIVGDLRVLLTNINPEEKQQIKEILGHDLWSLILQASRASDDDGARAVLENMMRYIKQNPSLATALFTAGKVIHGPRFEAFIVILKRGGAIT